MILMGGKQFLQQIKKEEVNFALIGKLKSEVTSREIIDIPNEI